MISNNNLQEFKYEPFMKERLNIFQSTFKMLQNMYVSRYLVWTLFKRDFLASYRTSFLGLTWILISPIVGIISWVFMNSAGLLSPGEIGIPYPVYILIGSSMWGLFMGFYTSASGTLNAGVGFITQVNYPHEALLLKQIIQHIANFLITFLINMLVILLYGIELRIEILLLPLVVLPMFFLAAGIGIVISVVQVVASDLVNIFNIMLGIVFYLTPIVYTSESITSDLISNVVDLNPLTYIVADIRDIILFGEFNNPIQLIIIGALSFIFFIFALRFFYLSEYKVIEKML